MNRLIRSPHLIFWISIPIILIISFLIKKGSTVDINVHDMYFIIHNSTIILLLAGMFGILGFGYWSLFIYNRRFYRWLTIFHIVITIGGMITILLAPLIFEETNDLILLTILLIALAQVLYLINLISSLIRKPN